MPDAWRALFRCAFKKAKAINTILPLSDLIEAIRHLKTLRQQRSSPLFVARALDPPLFRCPKRASVPRGCEVEQGRRRATPDRRLQKRAERCGPTPSPGTAAPPNFFDWIPRALRGGTTRTPLMSVDLWFTCAGPGAGRAIEPGPVAERAPPGHSRHVGEIPLSPRRQWRFPAHAGVGRNRPWPGRKQCVSRRSQTASGSFWRLRHL